MPRTHSAYLVTESTEPRVEVDSFLVDAGMERHREWCVMDTNTGATTEWVGVRIARLCPTCREKHNVVALLDHLGDCGSDGLREQAQAFMETQRNLVSAGVTEEPADG